MSRSRFDSASRSSMRAAVTANTRSPSSRRARYAMNRKDARSHHCRSSIERHNGRRPRRWPSARTSHTRPRTNPRLGLVLVRRREHPSGRFSRTGQPAIPAIRVQQQQLEQLPDNAERQLPLEIAAPRRHHPKPRRPGLLTSCGEQAALADPGRSLEQRQNGITRRRALHQPVEHRSSRSRSSSTPPRSPRSAEVHFAMPPARIIPAQ